MMQSVPVKGSFKKKITDKVSLGDAFAAHAALEASDSDLGDSMGGYAKQYDYPDAAEAMVASAAHRGHNITVTVHQDERHVWLEVNGTLRLSSHDIDRNGSDVAVNDELEQIWAER